MNELLDKNGVVIEEFDVLKVFHFVGARKKKHYMYKVAVLWEGKLYGSHIESNPLKPNYPLWITGANLEETEVVQSRNWRKLDKPKKKKTSQIPDSP
jgi:hypothetical protein